MISFMAATTQISGPLEPISWSDIRASLSLGLRDFRKTARLSVPFSAIFVLSGLFISWVTVATGHSFWLILAVMGFPLIGTLGAVGFYEISRRLVAGDPLSFGEIANSVWSHRSGQLPWLAAIIIVVFLFWFFLGHMIFALFLGLSPMTNVSTSLAIYLTPEGLMMLGFGTLIGAGFATLVFALSVHGMPMLFDRDVDFITAMLTSLSAVLDRPILYLSWGTIIAVVTLVSMLPGFLGLFLSLPVLGHTTWHLYRRASGEG